MSGIEAVTVRGKIRNSILKLLRYTSMFRGKGGSVVLVDGLHTL